MLDLADIPIWSYKRGESTPIIIAGGHSTFNPEPMHAFIDAFIIGEGEEVIEEILDVIAYGKSEKLSREEILSQLSEISQYND